MTDKPAGIIPHLAVDGAAAAIEFYKKALGATEMGRVPADDGKRLLHAALQVNGGTFFLHDDFPEYCDSAGASVSRPPKTVGGTSVTMHLIVANCDEAVKRAETAGATVTIAPHDAFWGDRYAEVVDPFGHPWSFSHPLPGRPS